MARLLRQGSYLGLGGESLIRGTRALPTDWIRSRRSLRGGVILLPVVFDCPAASAPSPTH